MGQITKKFQVFDVIGTQCVFAQRGNDCIVTFARSLINYIALRIDNIHVIAKSATHCVVT